MAEPSAEPPPLTPHQASGSAVRVPESVKERRDINVNLTAAVFAAHAAGE